MSYVLGLDFGTSFTAAAAHSAGTTRVVTLGNRAGAVPSVLLVRADGTMIFGEEAYLRGASEPDRLVRNLKRHMGSAAPVVVAGQHYPVEELVAAYLRWVAQRVAEREGGPPERVVATHPANWRSSRLDVFRRAVELSGIGPVSYVTEPYAAAVFQAQGHPLDLGDIVAAYDLGGGTFDAAMLRRTTSGFEQAAEPDGVEDLGGVDFDDVMLHLVQTKLGATWTAAERRGGAAFATAAAGLRRECVAAKEALSVDESVDIPVILPGVSEPVRVTRAEFERLIRPIVADTLGTFRREVQAAGVQPRELAALMLVGGSSRVPLVREMIAGFVGDDVTLLDTDPKHAVARGAALLASDPEALQAATAFPAAAVLPATTALPAATAARPVTSGPGGTHPGDGGVALASPASAPAVGATPGAAGAAVAAGVAVAGGVAGPGAADAGPQGAVGAAGQAPPAPGQPVVGPSGNGGAAGPGPAANGAAATGPGGERRRKRSLVFAGVLAVVALGAAGLIYAANRSGGGKDDLATIGNGSEGTGAGGAGAGSTTPDGAASTTSTVARPKLVASADRTSAVPAGSYSLGLAAPSSESAAAQTVTLTAFFIDSFEVTNAEYDKFVQSQGAPAPLSWPRAGFPAAQAAFPVTGVEWGWAQAYCSALGKRLPKEAEWEAAARGTAGSLYPWGDNPAAVDLDTPGDKAVGSVAGNVSPFGVHDTVGSAWEWVDVPYTTVNPTQRVRRGGENGRVRDGAAMRQVVELTNESATAETGFRCAADTVDPKVAPGQFSDEHAVPDKVAAPTTTATKPGASAVLVDDTFEDTKSGWADKTDGVFKIGYHAPTWYHLDAAQPGVQVVALGGFQYSDTSAVAKAYVDKVAETGRFRYGLVFRAEGPQRPPPGAKGPARPEDFYAFVVDPRSGRWELIHEDTLPMRRILEGPLPAGFKVKDGSAPDTLRADMRGSAVTLFINDAQVGTFDTRGYHLSGDIGFYVETFDAAKVHVHFDELKVTALPPA